MTQCAEIIKELTDPDPNPNKDLPGQYHERTGHVLPVQAEENKLKMYAKENKIVINESKNQSNALQEKNCAQDLP